ncbi:MAG TPA: hypothetical protein VN651_08280 [Gemmatimonadaceae bacterium]|nr:hypothetical protein [Gemmatimonadaceae bacterium]
MGGPFARLAAPITACLVAGGSIVVGGACVVRSATSPPPPQLDSRPYVLTGSNLGPPPLTITDASGRRLRVIADTITFATATLSYRSSGTAAVTPPGAPEQPPGNVTITERSYQLLGTTLTLPATIGGAATANVEFGAIQVKMLDGTFWIYAER